MTAIAIRPRRLAAFALAASLFVGSLVLWIGIPVGWLWVSSRLSETYPTIWALAVFGCPVTMAAWGLLLGRLNLVYLRVSGGALEQHHAAWLKSLSGERGARRPRSVLDVSMTISVILAMLTLLIWFFFFAENYSPGRFL